MKRKNNKKTHPELQFNVSPSRSINIQFSFHKDTIHCKFFPSHWATPEGLLLKAEWRFPHIPVSLGESLTEDCDSESFNAFKSQLNQVLTSKILLFFHSMTISETFSTVTSWKRVIIKKCCSCTSAAENKNKNKVLLFVSGLKVNLIFLWREAKCTQNVTI